MAREKRFAIRLTRSQLETLQRVVELAVPEASAEQMQELEAIDGLIYGALHPDLVKPRADNKRSGQNRLHPMSLRALGHLRVVQRGE